MGGMSLHDWTDLDLAYLLIFGEHPDLYELDEPPVTGGDVNGSSAATLLRFGQGSKP